MTKPKPLPEIQKCPNPNCRSNPRFCAGNVSVRIVCSACFISGPMCKTRRGAILAWNRLTLKEKA